MSNDDENKGPSISKNHSNNIELSSRKEKKSSTSSQIQYRILRRGQPDESTPIKKSQLQNELNTSKNSTTGRSQRNRRKFKLEINNLFRTCLLSYIGRIDRRSHNDTNDKQQNQLQPFSNLTNNNSSNGQNSHAFRYGGPRCWKHFRLNRSEVFRCLRE